MNKEIEDDFVTDETATIKIKEEVDDINIVYMGIPDADQNIEVKSEPTEPATILTADDNGIDGIMDIKCEEDVAYTPSTIINVRPKKLVEVKMKQMTHSEKVLAIQLHERGFATVFIASQLKRTRLVIWKLINAWKNGTFEKLSTLKRRGTPRSKLKAQQVFKVLNYFIEFPFHTHLQCVKNLNLPVTARTISNVLKRNGVKSYVASKLFLSMQNQIKRLQFAMKYEKWTTEWLGVRFLDEITIQTYANGRALVKRMVRDKIVASEVRNNKVNLVGTVSYNGPNIIYSVGNNFTGQQFNQLIRTKVKNVVDGSTVLMDNASIHANAKCLSEIRVLKDFPRKSRDLNVIENVWAMLQRILNQKLRNLHVSTKEELLTLIEASWKEIPVNFITKCVSSMPHRLQEVIRNKGKQTRF